MGQIKYNIIRSGFDKKHCYVHARGGTLADGSIVMTAQKLLITGMDAFEPLETMKSTDGGTTWSEPRTEEGFSNKKDGEIDICCCDFTPGFHKESGKLLGIGHTVRYLGNSRPHAGKRETSYAVYNDEEERWNFWQTLKMPEEEKFFNAGAGCVQRVDLPGGDILLPFYGKDGNIYYSSVMRCSFDGETLTYQTQGNELCEDRGGRGLYEPSLTFFENKYYLTMRADNYGYVSTSDDGLNFCEPVVWRWDNGTILPTYNTQQHWVSHSQEGLFLVYTRRGADNDHVFRHRAPLFMAKVDTNTLRVIKDTERIVVPQRGARLGNFGVTHISPLETIITVTEWMQPIGCEKYGSDNAFYISKISWDKENKYFL